MSEQRNSASPSMREVMPETARWVDKAREKWGAEYVNDCVRRAIAGEPGLFYAMENGYLLGTPFHAADPNKIHELQRFAIVAGSPFAAFMARPKEGANGAD